MANTSPEEPKAPIVRIRKKRTKKKKEDVVHLPVRASRTARYSIQTTPTNPQSKGRECCRNIFATCFKIPVCRSLCFRCILPRCYTGEESDEEDGEARDEGYHSQNRRSSEITPPTGGRASGATGGITDIEMTEMKSETVALIPPPRSTTNDYKRHPAPKVYASSMQNHQDDVSKDDDVTYIEVESVSLPGDTLYIPDSNLLNEISEIVNLSGSNNERDLIETDQTTEKEYCDDHRDESRKSSCKSESGKESELQEAALPESVEYTVPRTDVQPTEGTQYVECDPAASDESQYYVNEEVLFRPAPESSSNVRDHNRETHNNTEDYANADAAKPRSKNESLHSKSQPGNRAKAPMPGEKPPEYVNIKSPGKDSATTDDSEFAVVGMVKTSSAEFKKLLDKSGMRFSKKSKASLKSVQNHQPAMDTNSHSSGKDTDKLVQNEQTPAKEVVTKTDSYKVSKSETDVINERVGEADPEKTKPLHITCL